MRTLTPFGNLSLAVLFCFVATLGFSGCSDVSKGPAAAAAPVPLSPDAKLSSLTVSPGTLQPTFSRDVANYTVDVAFNVASVTVTATPQDANATMTINGQPTASGQPRTVTLGGAGSSTPIPIVVTALNGSQNTYIATVNRTVNTSLQSLTVSPGTLTPAFAPSTTIYTVDVLTTVTSVTVTATPQDANATMTINGQPTASGQPRTVTLGGAGSSTPIPIVVTAPNGSQNTYIATVNRAAPGGNNNLLSLTVSPGTLTPAFAPSTTIYTVDVLTTVTSVTVTATPQDANATMTINGQPTASGQPRTVTLGGAGSSTPIPIVVTAPNGFPQTYTVTVNRATPGGNNNLLSLTVSPGTLTPAFAPSTTIYTVDVLTTVTSVTVTATPQDANATMTINGQPTASGQPRTVTLGGAGSSTPIPIVVTAPNGFPQTYIVTVNRAAPSSNNDLSALSVTGQTLSPAFNANTLNYTVAVASTVTQVTVSATKSDPNAVMSGSVIAGAGVATGQATIPLNGAGTSTPVSITVTAPNGSSKTYTVTVNRAAALSGNNDLSALVVSAGALVPVFNAATTSYNVAATGALVTTVTATVVDSTATLMINGLPAISGVPSAPFVILGPLSIDIDVTAENGTPPKTYTVNITP